MDAHPYAELFPLADDATIQEMAADIRQRGQLHKIITHEKKILDGRNRQRACEIAGVEPKYEEYSGTDALGDVVSWNLRRRNMTPSERAAVAAELANMTKADGGRVGAERQGKGPANLPIPPVSQSDAALVCQVSERSVRDAVAVKDKAPELFAEVKAGRLTVAAAKRWAKAGVTTTAEKDGVSRANKEKRVAVRAMTEREFREAKETKGGEYAAAAINELRKIKQTDPSRAVALRMVADWCRRHA